MFSIDAFISKIIKSRFTSGNRKQKKQLHHFDAREVTEVLNNGSEVLKNDPILLKLPANITIVGDLHGNIDDLLRIFTRCGYPPETNYIFLGDYVDRGENSIEVFLMLLSLKIKFPENIYLLRGNHESNSMTGIYGFRAEVRRRLNKQMYFKFLDCFKTLPIAAVIDNRVFCVHGGISKELHKVEQLSNLRKPNEIPLSGIISDMLWSDPMDYVDTFLPSDRGVGALFGAKPLQKFLDDNKLELLVRSHESCDKGFNWPFEGQEVGSHSCLTIFSSSNYCDECNDSAVLSVPKDGDYQIISFTHGKQVRFALPKWLINSQPVEKALSPAEDEIPTSISSADFLLLTA